MLTKPGTRHWQLLGALPQTLNPLTPLIQHIQFLDPVSLSSPDLECRQFVVV